MCIEWYFRLHFCYLSQKTLLRAMKKVLKIVTTSHDMTRHFSPSSLWKWCLMACAMHTKPKARLRSEWMIRALLKGLFFAPSWNKRGFDSFYRLFLLFLLLLLLLYRSIFCVFTISFFFKLYLSFCYSFLEVVLLKVSSSLGLSPSACGGDKKFGVERPASYGEPPFLSGIFDGRSITGRN